MATYLQGVTDFIPQYQPFTPDLNFYDTVLKTKQNQYDSNWKQLNKVYGQYFYADLTRDDNIKKKEELVKNIGFNLQRVAGLDLSLQQNVDQAVQVFTPFYQDKSLMKDMAYTKNWNNQYNLAKSFKNSSDEKERKRWWGAGIREMEYLRDEFKNATEDQAMTFRSPSYTSYVNSSELAQKIAKDAGLSAQTVKFSKDGKFIITTKNGQQIKEPLQKLFENQVASDPRVQAVYKTQSYVNRKDYAFGNAAEFNGDKNAAEMKYLENNYKILQNQNKKYYLGLKQRDEQYNDKIAGLEEIVNSGKASPRQVMLLDDLKLNRDINSQSLQRIEKEYAQFKNGSSTATTASGFENPYEDINTLRRRVDGGVAQMLMKKDLDEAAQVQSMRGFSESIKTNPYALQRQKAADARRLQRNKQKFQSGMQSRKEQMAANKLMAQAKKDSPLFEPDVQEKKFRIGIQNGQPVKVYEDQVPANVFSSLNPQSEGTEQVIATDQFGIPQYRERKEFTVTEARQNNNAGGTTNKLSTAELERAMKGVARDEKKAIQNDINKSKNDLIDLKEFMIKDPNFAKDWEQISEGQDLDQLLDNIKTGKSMNTSTEGLIKIIKNSQGYVNNHKEDADAFGKYATDRHLGRAFNNGTIENLKVHRENMIKSVEWLQSNDENLSKFGEKVESEYGIKLNRTMLNALDKGGTDGELLFTKSVREQGYKAPPKGGSAIGTIIGLYNAVVPDSWEVGSTGQNQAIPQKELYDVFQGMYNEYKESTASKDISDLLTMNAGVTSKGNTIGSNLTEVQDPGINQGPGGNTFRTFYYTDWQNADKGLLDYSIKGGLISNRNLTDGALDTDEYALQKDKMEGLINNYGPWREKNKRGGKISYSSIADKTLDKEATILSFPKAYLDSQTGDGKLLTPEENISISANDVQIIAPNGTFTHSLTQDNESAMDKSIRLAGPEGKTFELEGDATYKVTFDPLTKMYHTNLQLLYLSPNGYDYVEKPGTYTAGNWEHSYNVMYDEAAATNKFNTEQFNLIYPNLDKQTWNDQQLTTWDKMRTTILNNKFSNKGPVKFITGGDYMTGGQRTQRSSDFRGGGWVGDRFVQDYSAADIYQDQGLTYSPQ